MASVNIFGSRFPASIVLDDRNTHGRQCQKRFNQAIECGIDKANEKINDEDQQIPHWHPNQFRHNAAAVLRKEYGIELARIVLGDSTACTTEIDAEAGRHQALVAVASLLVAR